MKVYIVKTGEYNCECDEEHSWISFVSSDLEKAREFANNKRNEKNFAEFKRECRILEFDVDGGGTGKGNTIDVVKPDERESRKLKLDYVIFQKKQSYNWRCNDLEVVKRDLKTMENELYDLNREYEELC